MALESSKVPAWGSPEIEQFRQWLRRAEPPYPSLAEDGWLAHSCAAPQLGPLCRFLSERSTPLKSHPGQGYDFFHDLVQRHPMPTQPLMRAYSRRSGWRVLVRGELQTRSARLAAAWMRRGVEAGKKVALLLPQGPEYVVALTTALRMGLLICPLPPRGPLLTARRLAKLAPDFVYTLSLYTPLLQGTGLLDEQVLLDEPPETARDDYYASFTYPPKSPVFALYSPVREPAEEPTMVFAETAFGGALRDLLLVFALEPGDAMAAPGAWAEQYFPGLVLQALLGRVTYVHCELEDLKSEPRLLASAGVQLLLVTRALRALLQAAPSGAVGKPECVLRDPVESTDLGVWKAFLSAQGLGKTALGNLIYDSASGGALLASARRREYASSDLLPTAVRGFSLQVPAVTPRPAINNQGLFLPADDKQGFVLVARSEDQLFCIGALPQRREGRLYPEQSALAALATLPFIDGAAFAFVPVGDSSGRALLVLIVLTGAEPREHFAEAQSERMEAIRQRLRTQLGEPFLPDQIELFPLLARREKGAVDGDRLRAEYQSGALHQKSHDRRIALLHRILHTCRNTVLDRLQAEARAASRAPEAPC